MLRLVRKRKGLPAEGDYVDALRRIRDEVVPTIPSDDLLNVHVPGSYAERVRAIAIEALGEEG